MFSLKSTFQLVDFILAKIICLNPKSSTLSLHHFERSDNWVFPKFQLISKIWLICLICLIFLPLKKRQNVMVTHHRFRLFLGCLTSEIGPFTLIALTFGSCLYCANVSHYKDGWAVNFSFFAQRDNRIPNLNASITAQHKHEPAVKAVRANGQITEVKQPKTNLILRWVTHLGSIHFVFFQWQKYQANLSNFTNQLEFWKNSNAVSQNYNIYLLALLKRIRASKAILDCRKFFKA